MQNNHEFQSGALLDTRSDSEKAKDFKFHELVAEAAPVKWEEKTLEQCRQFPIFFQNGSGSCVAQTRAKEMGVDYFNKNGVYVHFSATDIYQRRSNKPNGGMIGVDAYDLCREGVTLEVLAPSQGMTDEQMDKTLIEPYKREVGAIFKTGNHVDLPIGDIDTIASVIQKTKKAVMVWFFFRGDEWTDKPVILDPNLTKEVAPARHSVAAIDFLLIGGVKHLLIEDSWGVGAGKGGRRLISEKFFTARNYFAHYGLGFKFAETQDKPILKFTEAMRFLDDPALSKSEQRRIDITQKESVKKLQQILQSEGFFPANVETTGYYGAVTARAVLTWQIKNKVDSIDALTHLRGWFFGAKSIAKANELYA